MSYTCLSIVLGIFLVFSGAIGNGISNLLHKKRAKSAATDNAPCKSLWLKFTR